MTKKGLSIQVTGVVQGVGFRSFVYQLAQTHQLTGWVRNTTTGVEIQLDGDEPEFQAFLTDLTRSTPPMARLERIQSALVPPSGFDTFEIRSSETEGTASQPIPPDMAICADCLAEATNPKDRRYRYPFVSCPNCGPRFTIIKDLPYDRAHTTLADFPLCADCAAEYNDPSSRRFRSEALACPKCGPKVWLEEFPQSRGKSSRAVLIHVGEEGLQRARQYISEGKILVVKGLGGFQLVCSAKNPQAVAELRQRKASVERPFSLMMPDFETVKRHFHISDTERELLESPARPIVLLRRRSMSMISPEIAPRQRTVGVMLPYSALHHLLLEPTKGFPDALVMTSATIDGMPACTDNGDARILLDGIGDAFLMHDREIHTSAEDSIVRAYYKNIYPIRRARGYAPFPVRLPWELPAVFAAGAELKNAFCITHGNDAFISPLTGGQDAPATLQTFQAGVAHFEKLFHLDPAAIACDQDAEYMSTRFARERAARENLPLFNIQHQHAHIAALMAEHQVDGSHPVIGVAFDGMGLGDDGHWWGGEFLLADYAGYRRLGHLGYFPLPGGDESARRPSFVALGLLHALGMDWNPALPPFADLTGEERAVLLSQLEQADNLPLTSSVGCLFDAAAALAGLRQRVNYEAQAAIEFEAQADPNELGDYPFRVGEQIELKDAIQALVDDVLSSVPLPVISARFHNGLARAVLEMCIRISDEHDISEVFLSGGVWQNIVLLRKTHALLEKAGFSVYLHRLVPTNDGGLALGQAAIAGYRLRMG